MNWLDDTHGVQFELVRHFLRRMFDGEWSSSPGQWKSAAIGVFSLFLPAGILLVREGDSIRNTRSNTINSRNRGYALRRRRRIALLTLLIALRDDRVAAMASLF